MCIYFKILKTCTMATVELSVQRISAKSCVVQFVGYAGKHEIYFKKKEQNPH